MLRIGEPCSHCLDAMPYAMDWSVQVPYLHGDVMGAVVGARRREREGLRAQ